MSNDHELLALAAKAAGFQPQGMEQDLMYLFGVQEGWNPLTDDGDALRLAVRLRMLVEIDKCHAMVNGNIEDLTGDADPFAATRRAIVRAAAELALVLP